MVAVLSGWKIECGDGEKPPKQGQAQGTEQHHRAGASSAENGDGGRNQNSLLRKEECPIVCDRQNLRVMRTMPIVRISPDYQRCTADSRKS
jgi:hypothetical protein